MSLHLSLQMTAEPCTKPTHHLFFNTAQYAALKGHEEDSEGYPELQKKVLKPNDFS